MKKTAPILLVVLCVAAFLLMTGSSLRESAVVDELAHIPAGYAYLRYFDYRLNPEHPPLLKTLAAAPLLFQNLKFPTDNPFWTTALNGEWGVGGAFLYGLGNNAESITRSARFFPILLTIGLILLTYAWARRLFGPKWALVPAIMTGLSPIVLAQGHYVTTDIAAAFGSMLALFALSNLMELPTRRNLLLAGLAFGVAEVMKFSTVVLVPVFFILFFFHWIGTAVRDRRLQQINASRRRSRTSPGRRALHYLGRFVLVMAIGFLLVVYPLYAVFTAGYPPDRQLSDTTQLLGPLPSGLCAAFHWSTWPNCAAHADVWMAGHTLTRPFAEYLLGILLVIERLTGTNTSYFLGQVYSHGTLLYFPVVYALKETLPVLIILAVALIVSLARVIGSIFRKRSRFSEYVVDEFPQFSMLVFITIYWAESLNSPLNIGVRHLLPTIPLFYLLATSALRRGFEDGSPRAAFARASFLGVMLVWLAGETAFTYPHYLSYFNELAGGTANGYRYVTDSNYDWGQDMLALQSWMNDHPEVDKLALDFFGGSNPAYYLGDRYIDWNSAKGDPSAQGIHWFAISINNLQDAIQPASADYSRNADDSYPWLLARHPNEPGLGEVPTPDARIGTTIFVYKM